MILLTTSHRPTRGIRTLCRELMRIIPGLIRVNRGKMSLYEVAEKASGLNAEKIVIIDRWEGGPGRIRLYKTGKNLVSQVSPQIYLGGVKFKREFKEFKGARRAGNPLFINGTDGDNQEIKRLKEELSSFFDIPIMNTYDATAKYPVAMRFSVEASGVLKVSFYSLPSNVEIGPRIIVSHVVWQI